MRTLTAQHVDLTVLEPGQRFVATQQRLTRGPLSRSAKFLLVGLRIYVLVAVPLVALTFVHAVK